LTTAAHRRAGNAGQTQARPRRAFFPSDYASTMSLFVLIKVFPFAWNALILSLHGRKFASPWPLLKEQ